MQAHLAEYQALMARCNYFIALHVGLWSVIVAVAVGATQVWLNRRSSAAVWLSLAGIQGLLQIWSELIEEQYRAVAYIEKELRNGIERAWRAPSGQRFWMYEAFLARSRPEPSWLIQWFHPVAVGIFFTVFSAYQATAVATDWPWAAVNILLLIFLSFKTKARIGAHVQLQAVVEAVNAAARAA